MKQNKTDSTIVLLLTLAIVFSIGGVVLNYVLLSSVNVPVLSVTGRVTDSSSTVTLTQSGSAGIVMEDNSIDLGQGYYNASCTTGVSILDSNKTYGGSGTNDQRASPACWINTTNSLGALNGFRLGNNGSVKVNVSAYGNQQDGETLFCGKASPGGCPFTSNAGVALFSENGEASSCPAGSLTSGFESILTQNTNTTVGICDSLDYQDDADLLDIWAKVNIPKDATAGGKTFTITFQALAA